MRSEPAPADLSLFFAPRSVALVGATDDMTKFGGRLLKQTLGFGFQGRIFPVNPRRSEIAGLRCYPGVLDLPEAPDHVGIVVPTGQILPVLRDCHARGARFATVFSAGFAEMGTESGRALQAGLTAFTRASGLRIMGPNCNGIVNFIDKFAMAATGGVAGPRRRADDVGIVAQSGGLGQVNVMWRAQQAGVGLSYEVSCGNEADLDAFDFARFMIESDTTQVVLLALEAVRDAGKFMALAERAAEREKPVVVLKFGRTESGSRAAASHTGALTGSDEVFDAAFRQFGLIRVNDSHELYDMAILLRDKRRPKGRRAASLSLSGGNVAQMADSGSQFGISWSDYSAQTQQRLAELLPGYGKVGNPFDITSAATGRPGMFRDALEILAEDANVDVMIPVYTFANTAELQHAVDLSKKSDKPVVVLWTGGCNDETTLSVEGMIELGVPAYRDTLTCLKAVRAAADYRAFLDSFRRRDLTARPGGIDATSARARIAGADGKILGERVTKEILAAYGMQVTVEKLARNADEAIAHANAIGWPAALKIESPDIAHKTEAGGVRLNLANSLQVKTAYEEIIASVKSFKPDARIDGVLVQQMAPAGIELMLGIAPDPIFGPVLVAGLGGIYVEVLRDVAHRIPPIDAAQALAMLRELRGFALLEGVRGQPPRDIAAICDCIARLSWLAHDLREVIAELDVNPLLAFARGALVVDALLIRKMEPQMNADERG